MEVGTIFIVTIAFIFVVLIWGPFARFGPSESAEICFMFLLLGAVLFVVLVIGLVKAGWESMRPMTKGWWSTTYHTQRSYPMLGFALVVMVVVIMISIPWRDGDITMMLLNLTTLLVSLAVALYQYNNMRKFPALATTTKMPRSETEEVVERVIRASGRNHHIGRKMAHQYGRMKRFIIDDGTEVRVSKGRGLKEIRSFVLVGPYNKEHGKKVKKLANRLDRDFKMLK